MTPDPDSGILTLKVPAITPLLHPHFSLISFIIGLVTLSLTGFTGLAIGTYLKLHEPSPPVYKSPERLVLQNHPDRQSKPISTFSKTMQCPDDGWLDCTTATLKISVICTPTYLERLQDICPGIHGARY